VALTSQGDFCPPSRNARHGSCFAGARRRASAELSPKYFGATRSSGMLASPNSANNPKYVLFTTLTYRLPAVYPTLHQHSRELKTRFDGKFDANSPAITKKAGTPRQRHELETAADEFSNCSIEVNRLLHGFLASPSPSLAGSKSKPLWRSSEFERPIKPQYGFSQRGHLRRSLRRQRMSGLWRILRRLLATATDQPPEQTRLTELLPIGEFAKSCLRFRRDSSRDKWIGTHTVNCSTRATGCLSCVSLRIRTKPHSLLRECRWSELPRSCSEFLDWCHLTRLVAALAQGETGPVGVPGRPPAMADAGGPKRN
jgi:hypothetical protein